MPANAKRAENSNNSDILMLPSDLLQSTYGTDGWTDDASRSGTLRAETTHEKQQGGEV